jgi:hypothetical protein
MHRGILWGNLRDGDNLEDLDLDGRIIVCGLKLSASE